MVAPGTAAERRLRLAFVGCGAIAHWHLTALRGAASRTEVTAAVDIDRDRALAMAKETGAEPFGSLDDALAAGTFDATLIMVPHRFHEELAVAAVRAGKHVLLEKPMAPTLDACDRILAAARQSTDCPENGRSSTGLTLGPGSPRWVRHFRGPECR